MRIPIRFLLATAMLISVAVAGAPAAGVAHAQEFTVVPVIEGLNARSAPSTSAPVVATVSQGDLVRILGQVAGEEVQAGNVVWFRTSNGNYIYSGSVRPAATSMIQMDSSTGRKIVVDRGAQVAYAVQDGEVVYSAPITVGTPAFQTPTGSYQIERRVADETMDSETVGIPRDSPDGYYLTGVLYTQYFNDGYALHYNYWSPPEAFGNYPGSHGCVGLRLADAEFFWNFADIGTPVIINP